MILAAALKQTILALFSQLAAAGKPCLLIVLVIQERF